MPLLRLQRNADEMVFEEFEFASYYRTTGISSPFQLKSSERRRMTNDDQQAHTLNAYGPFSILNQPATIHPTPPTSTSECLLVV